MTKERRAQQTEYISQDMARAMETGERNADAEAAKSNRRLDGISLVSLEFLTGSAHET